MFHTIYRGNSFIQDFIRMWLRGISICSAELLMESQSGMHSIKYLDWILWVFNKISPFVRKIYEILFKISGEEIYKQEDFLGFLKYFIQPPFIAPQIQLFPPCYFLLKNHVKILTTVWNMFYYLKFGLRYADQWDTDQRAHINRAYKKACFTLLKKFLYNYFVQKSARNYRPCFRENQPKRSFSIKWKWAFWACFRENWVYKFGQF